MFHYFRRAALLALFLPAACAIHPPPATPSAQLCNFVQWPIEVALPSAGRPGETAVAAAIDTAVEPVPARHLYDDISYALDHAATEPQQQPLAVLALSGGSQHGSFGAGFLDGWREAEGGHLPDFAVVTGISTGSILATFAFIGDTPAMVRGYSITNERELLTPIVRLRGGRPSTQSMLSVVRRGAVADLGPLRERLRIEITEDVLRQVALRHMHARRLYVGVVDVDAGQAVAFDLGEMATRYFATQDTGGRTRIRNCYVDAIVASSSAPLAALPVFIDNRMYVDGGARFGMFSDDVIQGVRAHNKVAGTQTPVYVIANGDLETGADCGKTADTLCEPPHPPAGAPDAAHRDWSLLTLAQRSEDILVNQVYRFSASRIISRGKEGDRVFFARIGADALTHSYTLNDPTLGTGSRTCAEWQIVDRDTLHPIQFFPRYMRCLIDYGRGRGSAHNWDGQPPSEMAVAPAGPKP
jgi:hypothetical protein